MKLNKLKNKKILILGFGREGMDTFLFLKKMFPNKNIGIADENEKVSLPSIRARSGITWHLGKNYIDSFDNYDLIIKSPGIPFKILPKSSLKKITTQTDIFFDNFLGTIVGVTGTKGKSTTSAMIYAILKSSGLKVHLAGNIGKPVLSLLSDSRLSQVCVYELSSHQLHNLKRSPHIAIFLNLFHEHLDYYKNFQEYGQAKANIALHQNKNDYLIFNKTDKLVAKFAKRSKAIKKPIIGEYYELDRNAAKEVGKIFKIPEEKIKKVIEKFKPLEHRLENVGTFSGITFYNDALSTIPETAIFAIRQFQDKVETIILGGYDRKIDFKNLAKEIFKSKIKNLIFFPTTGQIIWEEIKKIGGQKKFNAFFVDNMKDAVEIAYGNTSKEKICLLSCASTSFSIFKDYKEKGNLFKKFVKLLKK
jgi:UDP-N-acetylmuramoylalanine--D-glutamate ligase